MGSRKVGLFGSLRNKIVAGIVSVLATAGTTVTAVYWNAIVAQLTGEPANTGVIGPGGVGALPKLSMQKQTPSTKISLLGCTATEADKTVRIAEVPPGSTAALLGLIPGDIIEEVDIHRIETPENLSVRLAQSRLFFHTTLEVRRGNTSLRGAVTLASENSLMVQRPLQ